MSTASNRRSSRHKIWLVACAAAVALLAATTLTISWLKPGADVAAPRPTNGQVETIDQGLAYDANDLDTVMDNTDTVFVAKVLALTGRDEDAASTTFRVELLETIAGEPPAQPLVSQHGYVDAQGTLHIIEDQSLLEVGQIYVFATNAEPSLDLYSIAPGPHAARRLTPNEIPAVAEEYRAAR